MTTPEPIDLDALEALREAGTPGPWTAEYSGETGNVVLPPDYQSAREYVARTQLYHAQADAELIAAAVNALPELIAAARERDRLIEQGLKASAAIERVRALHDRPHWCALTGGIGDSFAKVPGMSWPCPTIRALDGDPT